MPTVVLLRHGESAWNKENRFTGWTDVDLSEKGVEEAGQAGTLLREGGYGFDLCFTSVLKRAIRTSWIALDALEHAHASAALDANELVPVMHLLADLLACRQAHKHQLAVPRGIEDPAEISILTSDLLYVRNESLHIICVLPPGLS